MHFFCALYISHLLLAEGSGVIRRLAAPHGRGMSSHGRAGWFESLLSMLVHQDII